MNVPDILEQPPAADGESGSQVRLADGNDLEAIVEIGHRSLPAVYDGVLEPELIQLLLQKRWTKQALTPSIRAGRTYVAEVDGHVVGVATVGRHDGKAVIWQLHVLPELVASGQAQRVGLDLVDAAVAAVDPGTTELYSSFTEGHHAAVPFFRQAGFEEVDREDQAGMPPLVWVRRPLVVRPAHGTPETFATGEDARVGTLFDDTLFDDRSTGDSR